MSESSLGCRIILIPPNVPNENQIGKQKKFRKRKKRKKSLQCTYVGRKRFKYKQKAKKNIHWNLKPVEGSNLKTWNKVKKVVAEEFPHNDEIGIEVTPSDDLRSYHINSDKVTEVIGFKPKHSVEDAIRGLCHAFQEGKLPNSLEDDKYFNVRTMKKIGAK